MTLRNRLQHAWNAFANKDPTKNTYSNRGPSYPYRYDRPRLSRGGERSIITSITNRIALDVAAMEFHHCIINADGCYVEDMNTGLNECLTLSANIDQTAKAFIQDAVLVMIDKGCVALVPIDTTDKTLDESDTIDNLNMSNEYDINSMRVGEIIEWFPRDVRVRVYDDTSGQKKDVIIGKEEVVILENPMYPVMNEPNSTMQRLIHKLGLLDITDEHTASGKLDMIIQVPYTIKSEARRRQATTRRTEIEMQLAESQYGIAYTDGTEKITQLNRPVENTLMKQVEFLTNQLFAQLGMTQSILDGTADEQTLLNYYTRIIEPIVSGLTDGMKRKFLSKANRDAMQSIVAFRDPFKLVPVNQIAEIADKFTRNRILTANEVRQIVGRKPSSDPDANKLINSNISQAKQTGNSDGNPAINNEEGDKQNGL